MHLDGAPLVEHVHQVADHRHEHVAHRRLPLHELSGKEVAIGVALLSPDIAAQRHVHANGILDGQDVRAIGGIAIAIAIAIPAAAIPIALHVLAAGLLHVVLQLRVEHPKAADGESAMTSLPEGTVRRLCARFHAEELRGGAPQVDAEALLARQMMELGLGEHLQRLVLLRLVVDVLQARITHHLAAVHLVLVGYGPGSRKRHHIVPLRLHGHGHQAAAGLLHAGILLHLLVEA